MTIVRSEVLTKFPQLLFGMSTVSGGVSAGTFGLNLSFNVNDDPANVRENRRKFFSALGITEECVAFTHQQHTSHILSVSVPGQNDTCDALVTDKKGLFLAISVADCAPVMLYDPRKSVIAGIHAGWRGTAKRIVEKSIQHMIRDNGTEPADLIAFIGPSAGKCCYEVGEEVAAQFPNECSAKNGNGKYFLDVKHANLVQLLENGVRNSNIEVNKDCTIHNPLFHSHRRDGKGSGRMFAVIGLQS
ncbi:MAG: peptidoglycan editing factor PgeF [Bacteriovoracaceae bacterium]|nr:peptidoglycan editing factor PgeF [Bacteroidota bacterium]